MDYHFTTSGTTNQAKIFTMSEELVEARVAAKVKGAAFESIKSLFCDLNPNSWSGFRAQRWAEKNGIKFFNNTGGSVASALTLFDNENIEGIIGGPNGLLAYAGGNHRFKAILATGSILKPQQSKSIRAGLGDQLWTSYGTSEVGSITLGTAEQAENLLGCVGTPCEGVKIEFDSNKKLRVKTSTMIAGYDDPELTNQFFQNGWFIPGDHGYLTDDNLLVLERRI